MATTIPRRADPTLRLSGLHTLKLAGQTCLAVRVTQHAGEHRYYITGHGLYMSLHAALSALATQ